MKGHQRRPGHAVAAQTYQREFHDPGLRRLAGTSLRVVVLAVFYLTASLPAAAEPPDGRCILVDSDAALDDFRAVAALAPTGRIAAIVTTEGVSNPSEGAGAMEALL